MTFSAFKDKYGREPSDFELEQEQKIEILELQIAGVRRDNAKLARDLDKALAAFHGERDRTINVQRHYFDNRQFQFTVDARFYYSLTHEEKLKRMKLSMLEGFRMAFENLSGWTAIRSELLEIARKV